MSRMDDPRKAFGKQIADRFSVTYDVRPADTAADGHGPRGYDRMGPLNPEHALIRIAVALSLKVLLSIGVRHYRAELLHRRVIRIRHAFESAPEFTLQV